MSNQQDLGFAKPQTHDGPVECLGMTFESDNARRAHFLGLLREKLRDPEFRKTPGFPEGSDEAILMMSDPPYYTACPNPFIADFVRAYGKPYNPAEEYRREPFAVDVSEGKTDQLYKAHGYHTKVPHLAIVPLILHYTKPGDIVLDGFCGSGMTGVAVQWCGAAPSAFRRSIGESWRAEAIGTPEWGTRRVILGDLGPAATIITANYNLHFDVNDFASAAQSILDEVEAELGWMYETRHTDGRNATINYTVWSEVFSCPECNSEVNFVKEAMDARTRRVHEEFPCPSCQARLTKKRLNRLYETRFDAAIGEAVRAPKRDPVLINYSVGKAKYEKTPDSADLAVIAKASSLVLPPEVSTKRLPYMHMTHERARMDDVGVSHVHHFFLTRSAHVLAAMWRRASNNPKVEIRNALKFWLDSHFVNLSIQNRYRPEVSFPYNPLSGVYYIGSAISEAHPFTAYENKLKRIVAGFGVTDRIRNAAIITTGDCASIGAPDNSVDYIFTDPPFGENIYYADLNYLVESWHRVVTNAANEAIVDRAKKKDVREYQALMQKCFHEYHRVLKPGRWMTVVFSNSSNGIWRAIQEAMGTAGFVVADVRTLDKQQGSYRQVTSSAVKQDLVISAYKPTETLLQKFSLGTVSADAVWAFVDEHLRNVPVFVGRAGQAEIISERTPQMLHDRMIAFHVQRSLAVPMSTGDFLAGLAQRYPTRDGMFFLSDQVAEFDRKRTSFTELRQLSLFVSDEASAIQWVRQQLANKPQSFQELQPVFMRELHAWAKYESTVELKDILEQCFLCYEGHGLVPSQIHAYLSSNFKELRNLSKDDPALISKARGRWFVPDSSKQADLEKLREKMLSKEFGEYAASAQRKLKQFRTEAVRVGFKTAYERGDYKTIVAVARKLPETVLQEDEKLLMYYDVASMRLGEE